MGTQQVKLGEHAEEILRGLLGAGHQCHGLTHRQLDQPRQQRVVGAAQHQRVHAGALQWLQITLCEAKHLPPAGDAALHEVDEPRTGHPGDDGVAGRRERVLVRAGRDRGFGADDTDAAIARGGDGPAHSGQDHLDDRHVVALAGVAQAGRRRGVAGDHQRLHATGHQVVPDGQRVRPHFRDGQRAVRAVCGVADIDDVFVG